MQGISDLLTGYERFRRNGWQEQRQRWQALSQGQSPRVMVIGCSDSRVEPAQIFDCNPGDIFVVRNVAALVPPYENQPGRHSVSAALEFAVQFLQVEDIIVLGHAMCGGCHAALHQTMADNPLGEGGFVANWIALLQEARDNVCAIHDTIDNAAAERAMEWAAVKVSLANLRSFPFVAEKENNQTLRLYGTFFGIDDGLLYLLNERSGEFAPAILHPST